MVSGSQGSKSSGSGFKNFGSGSHVYWDVTHYSLILVRTISNNRQNRRIQRPSGASLLLPPLIEPRRPRAGPRWSLNRIDSKSQIIGSLHRNGSSRVIDSVRSCGTECQQSVRIGPPVHSTDQAQIRPVCVCSIANVAGLKSLKSPEIAGLYISRNQPLRGAYSTLSPECVERCYSFRQSGKSGDQKFSIESGSRSSKVKRNIFFQ